MVARIKRTKAVFRSPMVRKQMQDTSERLRQTSQSLPEPGITERTKSAWRKGKDAINDVGQGASSAWRKGKSAARDMGKAAKQTLEKSKTPLKIAGGVGAAGIVGMTAHGMGRQAEREDAERAWRAAATRATQDGR